MSTAERAKAEAVAQVFDYLHRYRITLDDLINIGGEDLKSTDPGRKAKAQRVEKCWSLMAGLGVIFADLEGAAGQRPVERPSRRSNRRASPKTLCPQELSPLDPTPAKSLKTNDIRDNHPVEGSPKGRWRHKRRPTSGAATS